KGGFGRLRTAVGKNTHIGVWIIGKQVAESLNQAAGAWSDRELCLLRYLVGEDGLYRRNDLRMVMPEKTGASALNDIQYLVAFVSDEAVAEALRIDDVQINGRQYVFQ